MILKEEIQRQNFFYIIFAHSLQCTLNLLTQVNYSLYKYLRLAEIPVGKTGVPGVKTPAKVFNISSTTAQLKLWTELGKIILVNLTAHFISVIQYLTIHVHSFNPCRVQSSMEQ